MDPSSRTRGTRRRWVGFALIAMMAFGAMAGGAAAHNGADEHGTITWHDSEDGEAQRHTEFRYTNDSVELHCQFWVKGYNMSHPTGSVVGEYAYLSGINSYTEVAGNWTAQPNASGGWDFEAGPFTFSQDSMIRGFAVPGEETHEDKQGVGDYNHTTTAHRINYEACEEGQQEDDAEQPPECPEDVQAQARQGGDVQLGWNASERASSYVIEKETEDMFGTETVEVEDTGYLDTETEADTTYTYTVYAKNDAGTSEDCPSVQVTAIPFFDSPALVAMAAVGSLGAVGAVRVRRG